MISNGIFIVKLEFETLIKSYQATGEVGVMLLLLVVVVVVADVCDLRCLEKMIFEEKNFSAFRALEGRLTIVVVLALIQVVINIESEKRQKC